MPELSWDLFILVVFTVIIAYSFIIGKESTIKVIIGSYIAILTADGLGNLFQQYLLGYKPFTQFLNLMSINTPDKALIVFKILIFIIAIVAISVKGNFEVRREPSKGGVLGMLTSLIFGALSAGLIVSTLLTYVSGASFVQGQASLTSPTLSTVYANSQVVQVMIDNYNVWFALPAVVFVVWSMFKGGPNRSLVEEE
jgi:hypothetical protein